MTIIYLLVFYLLFEESPGDDGCLKSSDNMLQLKNMSLAFTWLLLRLVS